MPLSYLEIFNLHDIAHNTSVKCVETSQHLVWYFLNATTYWCSSKWKTQPLTRCFRLLVKHIAAVKDLKWPLFKGRLINVASLSRLSKHEVSPADRKSCVKGTGSSASRKLPSILVSLFRGQFIPEPEIHISPLTCTALHRSSLCWCDRPEVNIKQLRRCVRARRPLELFQSSCIDLLTTGLEVYLE